MHIRKLALAVFIFSLLGFMPNVYSEDEWPVCPLCRRANNQRAPYNQKAVATFSRGAANAAFGWTEIIYEPSKEVKSGGSLAYGIGKGIGLAIKRTALGFGEMLTFWAPKGNKDKKEGYLTLSTDCPLCMGRDRSEKDKEKLRNALTE